MQTIIRLASAVAFSVFASTSFAALPQSGLWAFDGERTGKPGRGIQIDRQGETVIASYFGYRADGTAVFYQAVGKITDGKNFNADLIEYKNGRALGGSLQRGEEAKNLGAVIAEFDSSTTGSITLPGESKTNISQFTYGDMRHRLKLGFLTVYASDEDAQLNRRGVVGFEVSDNGKNFKMYEAIGIEMGDYEPPTCVYEGPLIRSGNGFRSEGTVTCDPPSREQTTYRIEDLMVSDFGILTARVYLMSSSRPQPYRRMLIGACVPGGPVSMITPMCTPEQLGLSTGKFPD